MLMVALTNLFHGESKIVLFFSHNEISFEILFVIHGLSEEMGFVFVHTSLTLGNEGGRNAVDLYSCTTTTYYVQ